MTLRVVELFSGIGAQRMALTLAGIPHEVVGVSEIDEPAIRSYTAIYGDCPNLGDITKVEKLPPCDLLTYSFPCQDLSIQGKKQGMGEGTRSGLVWEVMRLLKAAGERDKPEWLLMENVPLVLTSPLWEDLVQMLTDMGYFSKYGLLDSSDFGSAQSRVRAFMVSRRGGAAPPDLPKGGGERKCIMDILEQEPEERFLKEYPEEMMVWRKKIYDGIQVVADLDVPTTIETMRRVFSPKGLCRTLTKGDKGKQPKIIVGKTKGGFQVRTLSPRECWRSMGFPDWAYERAAAVSSDKNLYDQAGNSIVVDVLVSIFVSMFRTKGSHIQKRITEVVA